LLAAAVPVGIISPDMSRRLAALEAALYRGVAGVVEGGRTASIQGALLPPDDGAGREWIPQSVVHVLGNGPGPNPSLAAGDGVVVGARITRAEREAPPPATNGNSPAPAGLSEIGFLVTVLVTREGPCILTRIAED
jgi:hypothetical protein